MSNNTILEVDLPEAMKAQASTTTTCDSCGAKLGENWANKRDSISLYLPDGEYDNGDAKIKQFHYCNEACLRNGLNARATKVSNAHDDAVLASLEQEDEATARDISTKERNSMSDSQFLDQKNRSFPIKNCEDVKAAVRAWGRYKGAMSFETFKGKLTRKAKAIGCESSLPEKWKDGE